MLAAIGLAAMLAEFANVDWRSSLANIVGYWDQYVRPAARWLLDVVAAPFEWVFGRQVSVPLLVRDYLSVGLILLMSTIRAMAAQRRDTKRRAIPYLDDVRIAAQVVLLWPIYLLIYLSGLGLGIIAMVRRWFSPPAPGAVTKAEFRRAFVTFVLCVAPLGYLGMLLAINYLVL